MSIYKKEYFGIARKIVSNMTSESWEQIPHTAFSYEADVTEMLKYYHLLNEKISDPAEKITVNTLVLKIICEGLKAAPKMNTTLDFSRKFVRGTLNYHDNIDISMPMILKTGEMMTVNLHDMGNKSLPEIASTIANTVKRADRSDMNEVMFEVSMDNTLKGLKKGKIMQTLCRLFGSKTPGKHKVKTLTGKHKKEYYGIPKEQRLTKHDIEQGTTTISNLGSVYRGQKGQCFLLEIIPPQTTAFAVNAIQDRAVVIKDENGCKKIEIRQVLPITVAIDHRALDYGDCVPFFQKLDQIFKEPQIILNWAGIAADQSVINHEKEIKFEKQFEDSAIAV